MSRQKRSVPLPRFALEKDTLYSPQGQAGILIRQICASALTRLARPASQRWRSRHNHPLQMLFEPRKEQRDSHTSGITISKMIIPPTTSQVKMQTACFSKLSCLPECAVGQEGLDDRAIRIQRLNLLTNHPHFSGIQKFKPLEHTIFALANALIIGSKAAAVI